MTAAVIETDEEGLGAKMNLLISIVTLFNLSASWAGGGVSGGGDHHLAPSTQAEVYWVIKKVDRDFKNKIENLNLIKSDLMHIKDEPLRTALKNMLRNFGKLWTDDKRNIAA